MKILSELAKQNFENAYLVEQLISPNTKSPLWKLYKIVFSGKETTDSQAMQIIYGKYNLATFSRLKNKLCNILIDVSILKVAIKEPLHSRSNEILNQFKYTIAAKIFSQIKVSNLSVKIAEKTLIKSVKSHSSENVLILARLLILHYGSSEFNKIKLEKYINIQNNYFHIHVNEIKAENYYFELQQNQFKSLANPDPLIINRAKRYVDELDGILDVKTFLFYFNRYRVKATYFEYIKDFTALLALSDSAIIELSSAELRTSFSYTSIVIRKTYALIQTDKKDEAILVSNKVMKDLPAGSLPWYFLAHYKLKALLYKADYKNAVDLIRILIENPQFSKIGGNYRELFTATLGYIHLIVDSGIAGDTKKLKKNLPEFKIGKFLNTIPVFSKDKQGINVSILLMHVAILLQRKNHDAIIDRADSLKQYAYKYLRKDDTFRSNCMIKMVIQMTKAGFNPIRTERYTRDLLKQLEAVKLAGSGENIETEIIPYKVLWTIMKKAL